MLCWRQVLSVLCEHWFPRIKGGAKAETVSKWEPRCLGFSVRQFPVHFMKLNDSPSPSQNLPPQSPGHQTSTPPLTWLRLPDEPEAAYQDFLALWKDADPDVPILKQAQTEYAKLR